ncbi:MAG: hypothetical protein C5B50_01205 [Verrucomicrobia bacterium]|nr:MAG: hypothetical protein C5B50_01205 [Verrucomicrobiota bacterium]
MLFATVPARLASPGTINIPNYSFESPATSYVSINIDSWQKSPKPDWYQESGGFLWTQLTGIFKNTPPGSSDHIDNCDGNQALWLFAVPEVALFQDYDSTDWHNLPPNHQFNATFTPGKSYHLTVGVIGTGGGMLQGATLELSLYYRDAASNHIVVGVTSLTNDPTVFSNNTHLVDCRVDTATVKSADPWAGQHIGIQFKSTVSTNLQGGYWDLDNARLLEGPALLSPAFGNGQCTFTLLGEPGGVFQILTTTNPAVPMSNWRAGGIVTNATGSTGVTNAIGASQSFYRAVQLR